MINQQSLSKTILQIVALETPYRYFKQHLAEKNRLMDLLESTKYAYRQEKTDTICYEMHKSLNTLYDYQINAYANSSQYDPILMEIMLELEAEWIAYEKSRIPEVSIPEEHTKFPRWLRSYILTHQSSDHPLYEYLSQRSSFDEMNYFFSQEVTIDPRFDDLIAMMQIGVKDQGVKMELASNFWDEMGNGDQQQIHTVMFGELYNGLEIFKNGESFADVLDRASWQALASGNTLLYGVLHRKNFSISLGSLGTVEIISPLRFKRLVTGFRRLGLSEKACQYHEMHIKIDARHGNGWLHNAIMPVIEVNPTLKDDIFMGASLRLNTSHDYCQHVANQFNL